jgi:hypothetical protein
VSVRSARPVSKPWNILTVPLVCVAAGTVAITVFVSNLGNKIELAELQRKRADEAEAAERKVEAAERKRADEAEAAERKRADEAEAAERKRADEAEAAERKRVDDVVAAKTEGESSAQAQKLASIQAALRQISNDMADMKRNLQV